MENQNNQTVCSLDLSWSSLSSYGKGQDKTSKLLIIISYREMEIESEINLLFSTDICNFYSAFVGFPFNGNMPQP